MMVVTLERVMTKRPERSDMPVKMDSEVVRKAKIVAAFRGQSLAEFLSLTLGEIVDSMIDEAYAREKGGKRPAKEGRKGPAGK